MSSGSPIVDLYYAFLRIDVLVSGFTRVRVVELVRAVEQAL